MIVNEIFIIFIIFIINIVVNTQKPYDLFKYIEQLKNI